MENPYLELLGESPDGMEIFLVDGRFVRENMDFDFTEGGNHYRYPEFIPENEIWVDDDMSEDEREFVIVHEVIEATLMAQGMSYDDAHDRAGIAEEDLRKRAIRKMGLKNSSFQRISEAI